MIQWLLRPGEEQDQLPLQALLASQDMEAELPASEFIVAEIHGQLAGAARLEWEDQAVYLRPVVVDSAWHGKGIGRALVKMIAQEQPGLQVVARGEAAGFYRKLGFISMPWEKAPERYRQECLACLNYDECQPQLMILSRSPGNLNLYNEMEE